MKAKMCTPCEKRFEDYLQTHGKTLRARTIVPAQSRKKDKKVTCIICGRKRFGGEYDFDGRRILLIRRTVKG